MAANKISQCYVLFSVLGIFHVLPFVNSACIFPLGMESGKIKDSQITFSSAFGDLMSGGQARLRQNTTPWGGWCPEIEGGSTFIKKFDQYIQIDLLNLTKVTRVATQGREYNEGKEFAQKYKVSYSKDGSTWIFYPGKDNPTEAKIFEGNIDVSRVVVNDLSRTVTVRYIRVHPGYRKGMHVCMRLELYGCVSGENEKVILSYSVPIGQKTKSGKAQYNDTSYTGVISNESYKYGTGILTDGKFGPVNAYEFQGEGWVGWSPDFTDSPYIPIIFEFSDMRKFNNVTLTVNVDKNRDSAVFPRADIFLSSDERDFSNTSFLQYCPSLVPVNNDQYNTNITLSLCENTATFIKMKLYFGGRWLLISEINFNSVSVSADEKQSQQKCSGDSLVSCFVTRASTKVLLIKTTPRPISEVTTKSSNTPIIVGFVLSVLILLLIVLGILKYKRRHKGPQMTTSVNAPEAKDVLRPALKPIDFVVEPSSHNQAAEYATPAPISNLEPPYEEVQISPSSAYTELDRNKRCEIETSDDNTYQKLLKRDSDYVIPVHGGTESHEDVHISTPAGYTELDKGKQDESKTNHVDDYQKLLKHDPDYVIPCETEPYEEVGCSKTVRGYKELDDTKRELDDTASYQKLVKK